MKELDKSDKTDKYNLSELASLFTCVGNELKLAHLTARGKWFDRIHSLFEDLYKQVQSDADTLYELALQYDLDVVPPIFASKHIDYEPAMKNKDNIEDMNISGAIFLIKTLLNSLLSGINDVLSDSSLRVGTKSVLENMASIYEKELYYKNERRAKGVAK